MASLRRKYQQSHLVSPERDDGSPVLPPPVTGAKMPDPVETKSVESPETKSPADQAAESALRQRLKEMENAEALQRQPPQQASAPQQQQQEMPAAVAKFLAENPRYSDPNDAIAQGEIYVATLKCNRDGKNWNDDDFIPHLERHLGIAPAVNGNDVPKQNINTPPAPRHEAPPREPMRAPSPQRMSVPVSAPPTREPPSMSTGRSPRYRAPLTRDELEIAAACGQTPEQYQAQKERMLRMKANQEIQG